MANNDLDQTADLADLTPDPQNARSHGERNLALIASSLLDVGAGRSIVVDEDGTILAGNATVAAAARAGIGKVRIVDTDGSELIAVRRSNLTDDQKRRLALFDNRAAELADWDTEVLASLADDLDLSGLWDDDELAALLGQFDADAAPPRRTDPDDVPEIPLSPITQPGDLWVLGPHRLLCGDATKVEDLSVVLDGALAGLIVTDPPYGVAYEGKTSDRLTIANDDLDDTGLGSFLDAAFTAMHTVTKPGGAIYCFHSDSHGLVVRQAFRTAGWLHKQTLIWVKQSLVLGRQDYHWRHEPILYGWKPGAGHYFVEDRTQTTVWEVDRPSRNAEHPTMKPVELLTIAIGNSSLPGEVVLDPFAGSGSTLIACEQLGRRARLAEIDPRYCDVIVQRWESLTGKAAERVSPAGPERDSATVAA
jgi:DNA modification methylase